MKRSLFLLVLSAWHIMVHGQSIQLDPGFGTNGFVRTSYANQPTEFYASAIQPDGKIVAVGTTTGSTTRDFLVVRYLPDGSIDYSFSGDGMFTLGPDKSGIAKAVTIQPDGKILVAGSVLAGSTTDVVAVRLNPDGTLDNSFSGDGIAQTDVAGFSDDAKGIVLQPDGKIVVAGNASVTSFRGGLGFLAIRYNPDGTLDNSFSGDGIVTTIIAGNDLGNALLLQPDGKIVVAGSGGGLFNFMFNIEMVRYNPDGSLDASFDGDGLVTTNLGRGEIPRAAVLQPDGKIVIAGESLNPVITNVLIARYNSDGSLDNTFSGDGFAVMDLGSSQESFSALVLQPDGKLIAGGNYAGVDYLLMRFNADGTPDSSFGSNGMLITDFENGSDAIRGLNLVNNRLYATGVSSFGVIVGIVAVYILGDPPGSFSCLANRAVSMAPGLCQAIVNNIDPINPQGAFIRYVLSGATTGAGIGSASGLQFNAGVTTVTYSITNSAQSCSFTVTVTDTELPRAGFLSVPALCFNATNNYAIPLLQASDNCGIQSIAFEISGATNRSGTGNNASGVFLPGISTINWLITDVSGNQAALSTTVVVNSPIVVTIPDAMTLNSGVAPNTVYIGYGPASDLTLTAQASGGTPGYSYAWSNGATGQSITVMPAVSTVYTVTVTDAAGCSSTASKLVNVVDVRCGNKLDKVLVCKVPPGNPSNAQAICVSANAVQAQLSSGSYLGNCNQGLITSARTDVVISEESSGLLLAASPNPAQHSFTLNFSSANRSAGELVVWDVMGKIIERRAVVPGVIRLGENYGSGVYLVQVRQGGRVAALKLVKSK